MAELINIGPYANESERWAAELLAKELPDQYRVYTNFLLRADGQSYEVDQAVLADYTIHLVDVKGYSGTVTYDQREFDLDGRKHGRNALGKIGWLSRRLPDLWHEKLRTNSPWVQGCVFINGEKGENLELQHPAGQRLDVYCPETIVGHLKHAQYPREHNKIDLTRARAFEKLLCIPDPEKERTLAHFRFEGKAKSLTADGFLRAQRAHHQLMSLNILYQLLIVDRTKAPSRNAFDHAVEALRARFKAMMALRGIPGITRSLAPFEAEDGTLFVLPVEIPTGQNLADFCKQDSTQLAERVEVFLKVTRCLNEAHQRDIVNGALKATAITVAEDRYPVIGGWFQASGDEYNQKLSADVKAFAEMGPVCFGADAWAESVSEACPELTAWCEEVVDGQKTTIEDLIEALDKVSTPKLGPEAGEDEQSPFEIKSGAVVNNNYELLHRLGEGASGEVWAAKHLLGDFQCCVKIITLPYGAENAARAEFEVLTRLFHPNIVRLFSFEKIADTERFCLIMGMEDETLREVMDSATAAPEAPFKWFEGLLAALQYMKRLQEPVIHGDVKPRNIVVSGGRAALIDFNLAQADGHGGTPRYQSPIDTGTGQPGTLEADLYSLCLCFYEFLADYPEFAGGMPEIMALDAKPPKHFPARVFEKIKDVLAGEFPEPGEPLKGWFRLTGFTPTHEQPLPPAIEQKWNIRSDERFIMSTLLQAGGRMTKNQLIAKSAKWAFGHVGKKDKSRINPRLSVLRDEKELIDYPKGRQPRGRHIYVQIASDDLLNAWEKATTGG